MDGEGAGRAAWKWMAPGGARWLQVIFNPRCCGDRLAVARSRGLILLQKVPKVVKKPQSRPPRVAPGGPWRCWGPLEQLGTRWGARGVQGTVMGCAPPDTPLYPFLAAQLEGWR